jgi:Trypsin
VRRKLAAVLALVTALALAAPVAAITTGQPDEEEHPYVGELLFYVPDAVDPRFDDPGGWFSCTGTLLSSTVVVTAGHCTFGVGNGGVSTTNGGTATTAAEGGSGGNDIWINFGEVANFTGFPPSEPYIPGANQQRYVDRAAWLDDPANGWHRGTAYPHPDYDDNAFFIHDAGVVVLDAEVTGLGHGAIAPVKYLEQYRSTRRNEQRFEVVGYGLEKVLPKADFGGDTRRKAEPKLDNMNGNPRDTYIILSNNKKTGGTCFGDSGGPTFDNTTSNVVVAVTSFGSSPNCTGIGGAYRLDQPDDLDFLAGFGITP